MMTEKELIERATPAEEKILFHEKKIREEMLRLVPLRTEYCFVKWGLKLGARVTVRGVEYQVTRMNTDHTHLHHKKPIKPFLQGKRVDSMGNLSTFETHLMADWIIKA